MEATNELAEWPHMAASDPRQRKAPLNKIASEGIPDDEATLTR
jgi:hypothetical protein